MADIIKEQHLNRNIIIPKGSIFTEGPTKTVYYERHYELLIGIGNDHYAKLVIDEDALRALNLSKPEIAIF